MIKVAKCPTCRKRASAGDDNAWRPFCSERCSLIDLGAWMDDSRRIPAEEPAQDETAPRGPLTKH